MQFVYISVRVLDHQVRWLLENKGHPRWDERIQDVAEKLAEFVMVAALPSSIVMFKPGQKEVIEMATMVLTVLGSEHPRLFSQN